MYIEHRMCVDCGYRLCRYRPLRLQILQLAHTIVHPYIIHICGFALIQSESFLSMNGENMKKMQMQTPTTENRSANTANCNEFLHSFNSIFNIRAVYWFCIWSDVRQLLIHTRINEFANLNESRNQSGFRSKVYARIAMKLVRNDQLENWTESNKNRKCVRELKMFPNRVYGIWKRLHSHIQSHTTIWRRNKERIGVRKKWPARNRGICREFSVPRLCVR